MELRQLRLFAAVAEELHFGRAARRIHLSQPALTHQIQQLERDLGVRLFDRTNRKVELTRAGETLLSRALPLLAEADQVVAATRRVASGEVGVLTVGCVGSAFYSLIPPVVRSLRNAYPDVELVVLEEKTASQLTGLQSGRLDVGLVHLPLGELEGLEVLPLFDDPVGIALPETHRFAGSPQVPLARLADESFVIFPRELEPSTYDRLIGACEAVGFAPRIAQHGRGLQTLLGMVASGVGIAFVADSVMQNFARSGVAFCELTPAPELTTAIVWPREAPVALVGAFRDVVLAVVEHDLAVSAKRRSDLVILSETA